jgi:hypothetical protein
MEDQMMEEPMEQEGLLEAGDPGMIQELSDGISDYIHGDARQQIVDGLAGAQDDLDDTIAALSYGIMTQVSEQIAEESPQAVTFDVLLPLATETIDFLVEMVEAMQMPVDDVQDLRERSLMKMIQMHMAKVGDDPEQLAIAQEMLAEMTPGEVDEAMSYAQKKAEAEGASPEDIDAMAAQMLQPRQDPLAAGVQQGLMDQGGMG